LRKQLKAAQKHTTSQESALTALRTQLTSATASKADLEQLLQDKAQQLGHQQSSAAQQAAELQQLKGKHEQQTSELQGLKSKQEQQTGVCAQLEGTVAQQTADLAQLRRERDQQAVVTSQLEADLAAVSKQEEDLRSETDRQQEKLRTVQEQLAGDHHECICSRMQLFVPALTQSCLHACIGCPSANVQHSCGHSSK
jgi:chromosome segregation ATPase